MKDSFWLYPKDIIRWAIILTFMNKYKSHENFKNESKIFLEWNAPFRRSFLIISAGKKQFYIVRNLVIDQC